MDQPAIELAASRPGRARRIVAGALPRPGCSSAGRSSPSSAQGFTADDIAAVVDLYLAGTIATDHLTARTRPLEEANEALEDLREGRVMRSVLVP